MFRNLIALLTTFVALFSLPLTHAHQATERYIPVGYYADRHTLVGEISAHEPAQRKFAMLKETHTYVVQVSTDTKIWLDRSQLKQTNLSGSFADLQLGRKVEVKLAESQPGVAEWVKVQITESQ